MKLYLGIDPGKKGGIAIVDETGKLHRLAAMPLYGKELNLRELADLIRPAVPAIALALVERQDTFPGQAYGVAMQQRGYGMILGVLVALGLTPLTPGAAEWKKAMGLSLKRGKYDGEKLHKARLKELAITRAKELHPGEDFLATARSRVPHDGMAEAALLAEHARRLQHPTV